MQPGLTSSQDGAAGLLPVAPIPISLGEDIRHSIRHNIRASLKAIEDGRVQAFEPMVLPYGEARPPLHIVAGGSSAKETLGEIDGHICAVNGAHNWLLSCRMVPEYTILLDWMDVVFRNLKPHAHITYLLGSQAHVHALNVLDGYDVRIWHTGVEKDVLPPGTRWYGGGMGAVGRVMAVLYEYGYRDFHYHGVDGCYSRDGKSHSYEWPLVQNSTEKPIEIVCGGRKFHSRVDWVCQAQNFIEQLKVYDDWHARGELERVNMFIHGDGLLPHIARLRGFHFNSIRASGNPTYRGVNGHSRNS